MKTRAAVNWREGRAWLLALCLVQLAGACAQTVDTGGGETHFLDNCDTACGDQLECRGGVCTLPCDNDSACDELASNAKCVEQSCDVVCEDDASCRSVSASLTCVTGRCREPAVSTGAAGGGGEGGGGEGGGGTAGARGGEAGAPDQTLACADGCGDALCSVRSDSCPLETVCGAMGCGGFDVDQNGCYRPACESDDDCSASERCTARRSQFGCDRELEPCICDYPARVMRVCSTTAVTGPRGAWTSVTVTEQQFEVVTTRTFLPDGSVQKEVNIPPAMETLELKAFDLSLLKSIVDGPDLRSLLADPVECAPTEDYELAVQVELDTVTLAEKSVAGCNDASRPGISELQELVRAY
jgi:hypothetical protein